MFFDPCFDAPATLTSVMVITIPELEVVNHAGSLIEWSFVLKVTLRPFFAQTLLTASDRPLT